MTGPPDLSVTRSPALKSLAIESPPSLFGCVETSGGISWKAIYLGQPLAPQYGPTGDAAEVAYGAILQKRAHGHALTSYEQFYGQAYEERRTARNQPPETPLA